MLAPAATSAFEPRSSALLLSNDRSHRSPPRSCHVVHRERTDFAFFGEGNRIDGGGSIQQFHEKVTGAARRRHCRRGWCCPASCQRRSGPSTFHIGSASTPPPHARWSSLAACTRPGLLWSGRSACRPARTTVRAVMSAVNGTTILIVCFVGHSCARAMLGNNNGKSKVPAWTYDLIICFSRWTAPIVLWSASDGDHSR